MNLRLEDERKAAEQKMRQENRLPPGQSLTMKWPVLHYGSVPDFNPEDWDFRTAGLVEKALRLTWPEFLALPRIRVTADFHCVTRWSRFDNHWEGVAFRSVCELTQPHAMATHVLVRSTDGYTTNAPVADLLEGNVLFAINHDGEPLSPEHGGPLRLVAPHLYGWKSAKWVRGLEFLPQDHPGFWEQNGYHHYGDPWKEQRFDTDL
ncbi:MAG: sulfite oxidase-like oxidoreductase [Acidobacteriota bacterium]|nr:sulfite oxidase-like oxidoreductase [Acidobacteriota bacterium]